MFNPLKMAGDMQDMEKMLKPALEKFMNYSGFVKQAELEELKKRVVELEKEVR
jgi:polyhydroxyalkanoate synthesis regulator phasin